MNQTNKWTMVDGQKLLLELAALPNTVQWLATNCAACSRCALSPMASCTVSRRPAARLTYGCATRPAYTSPHTAASSSGAAAATRPRGRQHVNIPPTTPTRLLFLGEEEEELGSKAAYCWARVLRTQGQVVTMGLLLPLLFVCFRRRRHDAALVAVALPLARCVCVWGAAAVCLSLSLLWLRRGPPVRVRAVESGLALVVLSLEWLHTVYGRCNKDGRGAAFLLELSRNSCVELY